MVKKKVEDTYAIEKTLNDDSYFDDHEFVMDFPSSKFKLARKKSGANETYELYSKENGSWKHMGYYATIPSGLRGYLRHVPNKKLKGNVTIKEVLLFYKKISKEITQLEEI